MENATNALMIGFAVIVFVLALSVFMYMFTLLNTTSTEIIKSTDITAFYQYEGANEDRLSRIVGLETIIPTLYKYYKENFTIIFLDESGKPLELYKTVTEPDLWGSGLDIETGKNPNVGNIGKYYTKSETSYSTYDTQGIVCSFDVDEETTRHEPWTGTITDYKNNIDAFLNGGIFYYPSQQGVPAYEYSGFVKKYSNKKFREYLGEYTYTRKSDTNSEVSKKKRVIIYKLEN